VNWDAIGALSEFVGAAAVVATLAFLAVQIRQSRRTQQEANALARASAVDKVFDQFTGFRRLLGSDRDVMRVWMGGCAEDDLDPVDRERFAQLATDFLVVFANWEQRAAAVGISEMAEAATAGLIETLDFYPGLRTVWDQIAERMASPTLREAVAAAHSSRPQDQTAPGPPAV